MNASTSSSTSSVDTPGRTEARSRSMVSAKMCPAWRISAISRSDFRMIIAPPRPPHGSRCGSPRSILAGHRREQAALAVIGEQWRRLPRINLEPVPHGRLAVVLALVQLPTARVAYTRRPRGRRDEVVGGLAATADAPPGQTPQQLPLGDLEVDHAVERLPRVLQERS